MVKSDSYPVLGEVVSAIWDARFALRFAASQNDLLVQINSIYAVGESLQEAAGAPWHLMNSLDKVAEMLHQVRREYYIASTRPGTLDRTEVLALVEATVSYLDLAEDQARGWWMDLISFSEESAQVPSLEEIKSAVVQDLYADFAATEACWTNGCIAKTRILTTRTTSKVKAKTS